MLQRPGVGHFLGEPGGEATRRRCTLDPLVLPDHVGERRARRPRDRSADRVIVGDERSTGDGNRLGGIGRDGRTAVEDDVGARRASAGAG